MPRRRKKFERLAEQIEARETIAADGQTSYLTASSVG